MGQCAGVASRTPSALQLCQAFEQQVCEDTAQGTTPGAEPQPSAQQRPGEANSQQRQEAGSIWQHMARDEVRAVGEIVSAWAQRLIDGPVARRQLQLRVLRGHSAASVSLQNYLNSQMGAGTEGAARPGARAGPGPSTAWGREEPRAAPSGHIGGGGALVPAGGSSRTAAGPPPWPEAGNDQSGSNLANGIFAGLAAALVGGSQESQPTHEVFSMIDSVFLCRVFEDARLLAMQELGLEGARALPAEVRASFHRKAKAILEAAPRQSGPTISPWLDLVRLCLCVEVVRHLKAARNGASWESGGTTPASAAPLPSPLAAQLVRPFGPWEALAAGPERRGLRPEGPPGRHGMDVIFVTGLPHGDGIASISGIGFTRVVGAGEGPFRLDPDFLRGRVGLLLEVLLGGPDGIFGRPSGLTTEEMDQHCPVRVRGAADGDRCPVCLEPNVAGEEVRALPCSHEFHRECCEAWLATADTCPTCRFQIQRANP